MPFNAIFSKKTTRSDNFTAVDLPVHPAMQVAWNAWKKAADEKGGVPHYQTMRQHDLRSIMGYCGIVEMGLTSSVPFYRHVGTNLTLLYGQEIEGKFADQVFSGGLLNDVREAYEEVAFLRKPVFSTQKWPTFPVAKGYHRLILPYTYLSDKVQFFLTVIIPTDVEITKASDWQTAQDVMDWLELED